MFRLTAIQIVLVCFALYALSRVLLRFRRGGLPLLHLALWLVFWGGVIFVALDPAVTNIFAHVLGVGRGADVIIYLALMVLFYLVFRLLVKLTDLEQQMTRVVRAVALKELDESTAAGRDLPKV